MGHTIRTYHQFVPELHVLLEVFHKEIDSGAFHVFKGGPFLVLLGKRVAPLLEVRS